MKNIMMNQNFIRKVVISILIVLLLNFMLTPRVKADDGGWDIGGLLLDPVVKLLSTFGDAILAGLQMFLVDGDFGSGAGDGWFLVERSELGNFPEITNTDGATTKVSINAKNDGSGTALDSNWSVPNFKYTPEKIFSNQIPALDINFVNPTDWTKEENIDAETGEAMNNRSVASRLHETIATWYVSLRNLCAVGLMLVLLYVGIRIVISSSAADKSKYKQMLMDWLVALCILFAMHYIISFSISAVTEISKALAGDSGGSILVEVTNVDDGDVTFKTDLTGYVRFRLQSVGWLNSVLYLFLYIALVTYTCIFTFTYLKRVLIIAFLTLMAPMVALTYPLDKLRDGKAQAFNLWFKEFIFNIIIQPVHLLLYTIFVGSAVLDLATNNPLYAIIVMAFLTPAEKLIRKFFGFDQASTGQALGGTASAALGFVAGRLKSGGGRHHAGGASGKSDGKIRQKVEGDTGSFADALGGPSGEVNYIGEGEKEQIEPNNGIRQANSAITDGRDANNQGTRGQIAGVPTTTQNGVTTTQGGILLTGSAARQAQEQAQTANQTPRTPPNTNPTAKNNPYEKYSRKISDTTPVAPSQKNQSRASRVLKGLGNVGKNVAIAGARGTLHAGGRLAKGALNTVGRVAAAVPGAFIGAAMGVAGADLNDILQFGAIGGALTSQFAPNLAESAQSAGHFIANAYREGAGTADAWNVEQREKEFVKSDEWNDVLRKEFKNEDGSTLTARQLKERKRQMAYYDARGIGGKDAIKAMKMQDKIQKEIEINNEKKPQNSRLNSEQIAQNARGQAASIMKMGKEYDAKDLRDAGKVNALHNSIVESLTNGNFGQKEANAQAERAIKYLKEAKGVKIK